MTVAGNVLPKLVAPKGMKHLKNMDDLLTPEQKADLRKRLAEMAKLRRRAEAAARNREMY